MPLITLLDFLAPPPRPARPRKRRKASNNYLYVRNVKGNAIQARVWLGVREGGSLNLGLFTVAQWETREDAEWAAGRASKAFRTFYRPHVPGHGLRETLEHLKTRDLIPDRVLPPRVRQVKGGYCGFVRLAKLKRVVETPVFACPWKAYEAICRELERVQPAPRAPKRKPTRMASVAPSIRRPRLVTLADVMG